MTSRLSRPICQSILLMMLTPIVISAAEPSSRVLTGHDHWVLTVAISPDGNWLLSGGDDQTLRRWNLDTGKGRILRRCGSAVTAVAYKPHGNRIAVGTWNGELEICDVRTGKSLKRFAGPSI